ncbi:hypothetical protein DYI20_04640 [Auritidibacter ignavus]|nr:hypothetical protein DYI20_04640 [Auritidibacter ignavus]
MVRPGRRPRARGDQSSTVFLFGDNATELSTSACYEPETYQRLVDIKHHYDPANLIRLGRAIPVNAR